MSFCIDYVTPQSAVPANPPTQAHPPDPFKSLTINRYRFTLVTRTSVRLPRYKGSTFHGGLGHALRKISPTYYRMLFEPETSGRATSQIPKPYLLLPPLDELTEYPPNHTFHLELTLFGEAKNCFPICHAALEYLGGEMGIGEPRGKYMVQAVEESELHAVEPAPEHSMPDETTTNLRFMTRTRIKDQGRLLRDSLPFPVLFSRLLGRIDTLAHFYGTGRIIERDIRKNLQNQAVQIRCPSSNLNYDEWARFSGRQKQWMKFGGLLGTATYHGNLNPFLPYLRLGQHTHIGGKTSFGLGRYVMEE
ncbi:MAG: CRISPR system precrRNA processing endoribonuclease RAMP protein Cas6 [Desulfobulbaceae bacterium]|nr:CRISPR system precrRNA processing endoribonuclease RAMP protein Cas6 [Desulfobulbaceae bacterium]